MPTRVVLPPAAAAALLAAAPAHGSSQLIRHGVGFEASWDAFSANMAGLREHLWSNRLLQWLPLAGVVGIGLGVGSLAPEDSSATPASTS